MQLLFDSLELDDSMFNQIIRPPRYSYNESDLGNLPTYHNLFNIKNYLQENI